MGRRRALAVVLATVSLTSRTWQATAAVCPVKDDADVVQSAHYVACKNATGIDFDAKGKTPLDAKAFCGNANCFILWKQVLDVSVDALVCFQRYNVTGGYKLKKIKSSKKCFKANGIDAVITATQEFDDSGDSSNDDDDGDASSSGSGSRISGQSPIPVIPRHTPVTVVRGSPSSGASTGEADNKSSVAVIAGGSAGGMVFLSLVFAALVCIRRRRASGAKPIESPEDGGVYVPTLEFSPSSRAPRDSFKILKEKQTATEAVSSSSSLAVFWDDDVINAARVPYEKIKTESLLSRGGYGEVYRGTYRHLAVAIKRLLPERRNDRQQIENFLEEIKLLASLDHEHIVQFIGVAWKSVNELCAVTEHMPLGDLRAFLALYESSEDAPPRGFNPDKTKIALHVAKALTYLHSLQPVVLHRDLKSQNILLDVMLNAKLTDFGVAREQSNNTMTGGVGSSLWMAPEVLAGGQYDEKSDIFSFGVVLSELDTHRLPYSHIEDPVRGGRLPDTVIAQMVATRRITVKFTDEFSSVIAQLGCKCVDLDPAQRPTAAEIEHTLHKVHREMLM